MLPTEAALSGDSQHHIGTGFSPPSSGLDSSTSGMMLDLSEELRGPPSDPAWRSGILYAPVRSESQAAASVPVWRYLLTAVAGIGLFGLGMGLYWGFHVLTRSTSNATRPGPTAQLSLPATPTAPPTLEAIPAPPVQAAAPPAEAKTEITTPPAPEVKAEATPPTPPVPEVKAETPPPSASEVKAEATAPPPTSPPPVAAVAPAPSPSTQAVAAAEPPPAPLQPLAHANDGYDAFIGKVRNAMRRGQPSLAKYNLQKALKLRPQGPAALVLQAEMAIDEGDAETGARLAKKVLQLDPTLADAHIVLGMAAQVQGQGGVAKAHFKKYLELSPNGDRAKDVKAFLHAGY